LQQEHQAVGFYLSGHPLDDWMGALKRKGVLTLAEVARRAEGGPVVAKLAGSVGARQERKSSKGNRFAFVACSDPTGLYEVTVFSDVLDQARSLLEPGLNVVLTVEATLEGDTLKLLARGVQAVEGVAADAGASALRVHLAEAQAVAAVAALLDQARAAAGRVAKGEVRLCVADAATGQEIDIALPGQWPVGPQVKGALKAVSGVMAVEEL
jgi:DNA polymerase-3 subunit alpha